MNGSCRLCTTDLRPLILEAKAWRVVLNREQNLVGKSFVALKRHAELVIELNEGEWTELLEVTAVIVGRLRSAFQPDHFNFAFLGNLDRHAHLHIIPRYAAPRQAWGVTFVDSGWPGHYALERGPALTAEQLDLIAANLRRS